MDWRKISGLVLLGLGLAAPAFAAARAALADAAEQRDKTSVRTLLKTGVDVMRLWFALVILRRHRKPDLQPLVAHTEPADGTPHP